MVLIDFRRAASRTALATVHGTALPVIDLALGRQENQGVQLVSAHRATPAGMDKYHLYQEIRRLMDQLELDAVKAWNSSG